MGTHLEHKIIPTNGINLHVVFSGPEDGNPVILLHGFPEFWRGWLKQIEPLAKAGYRVIVPDQRGYNLSDKPKGVSAYHIDILAQDVIGLIDNMYEFTPVKFVNGSLVNEAGQNTGSCKIFAFAKRTRLSEEQTLHCFGSFYRNDVLKYPDNMDHENIRNFMQTGWEGLDMEGVPLNLKV